MEEIKTVAGRGRARVAVAAVVALHGVLVGSILLSQGCGTFRPRGQEAEVAEQPTSAPMPPTPAAERQKITAPPAPTYSEPTPAEQVPAVPEVVGPTCIIEKGDSLSSIAHRYGVSAREIAEMNGIRDPNKVRIGQKIVLPAYAKSEPLPRKAKKAAKPAPRADASAAVSAPAAGGEYVVKSGDILSRIAARNGTTVKALKAANNLTSDKLRIGQKLVLSGGKTTAPEATPAPVAPTIEAPSVDPLPLTPSEAAQASLTAVDPAAAVAPVAAAATAGDLPFEYPVAAGETLDDVARKFSVLKQDLITLNGLTSDSVKAGDKIKIPMAP